MCFRLAERNGQEWIRTTEGVSQRIYSPPRLAISEKTKHLKTKKIRRSSANASEGCARDCASLQGGEDHVQKDDRWRFRPVLDSRNRKIKGLTQRNGRIYGTIWIHRDGGNSSCRRFPLLDEEGKAVTCISKAKEAYERLRGDSRADKLPLVGQKPTIQQYSSEYLGSATTRSKRPRTVDKETQSLGLWVAFCGSLRIDKINTPSIRYFIERRLAGTRLMGRDYPAVTARTVALDLIALRNLLKSALDAGFIREIPRFPKLKVVPPPRRELVSDTDFKRLVDGSTKKKKTGEPITKNGVQLADLLKLLDSCGARETEAYSTTWKHVDFVGKRLWIGADPNFDATISHGSTGIGGITKNRRSRSVEFNPQLEKHLLGMRDRRDPKSIWLFPSPKRGKIDRPVISLRESLNLVRDVVGLKDFGFHDCRHRFTSRCVMAGIDYMTIAKWLGHSDGGILVGKVYGHLSDEHRKRMAERLDHGI